MSVTTMERRELKAVIAPRRIRRLAAAAAKHLLRLTDSVVETIYYDTADLALWRFAREHPDAGFRVRFRRYDGSGSGYFELKARADGRARKLRLPMSAPPSGLEPSFRPVAMVRCRRTAFESPDGLVRVTLDTDITWCAADGRPVSEAAEAVVELKTADHEPAWLKKAVGGMRTDAFSKFVTCVETLVRAGRL